MTFPSLPQPLNEPQCWSCLQSLEFRSLNLHGVGTLPWCADCWDRIPPAQRIAVVQQYLKYLQETKPESLQRKEEMHHAAIHLVRTLIAKLMATPEEGEEGFDHDWWRKGGMG